MLCASCMYGTSRNHQRRMIPEHVPKTTAYTGMSRCSAYRVGDDIRVAYHDHHLLYWSLGHLIDGLQVLGTFFASKMRVWNFMGVFKDLHSTKCQNFSVMSEVGSERMEVIIASRSYSFLAQSALTFHFNCMIKCCHILRRWVSVL